LICFICLTKRKEGKERLKEIASSFTGVRSALICFICLKRKGRKRKNKRDCIAAAVMMMMMMMIMGSLGTGQDPSVQDSSPEQKGVFDHCLHIIARLTQLRGRRSWLW
jgi:hypothetical protein